MARNDQLRREAKAKRRTARKEKRCLPETGFVRLPTVLDHIPISKSAWWAGVKDGRYPASIKLSAQTTAWRAEDIHALIQRLGERGDDRGAA